MKTVSAAEANRSFSKLLGDVKKGQEYVVTSHGKPVARLLPANSEEENAARESARKRLFDFLESQPVRNHPRVSRDEIYDYLDE